MKEEKRSFFELYASINDIKDFSKRTDVQIYSIKVVSDKGMNVAKKNKVLFNFQYIPIFNESAREELRVTYGNLSIFNSLLTMVDFVCFNLYSACFKEFTGRLKSALNIKRFIENEIKFLEKGNREEYLVFKDLDDDKMSNLNTYQNFKNLINRAILENISDLNFLIFGSEKTLKKSSDFVSYKTDYSRLLNSISNNVYQNFLYLLEESTKEEIKTSKTSQDEAKQKTYWFKTGLFFANGKIDRLLKKHKSDMSNPNFTAIAKELDFENYKSYRPYISESYNNRKEHDKNIFSDIKKMSYLDDYCNIHNITVVDSFKKLSKSSTK